MGLPELFFRYGVYYPATWIQAGPFHRHLHDLRSSQYWPAERIASLQAEKLRRLVREASRRSPYYRTSLAGVGPEELRTIGEITRLPLLEKRDLQSRGEDLLAADRPGRLAPKTTGGSTGQPVTVWKDRPAWARELAATWRGYEWAGVRIGDLQARFWGLPLDPAGRRRASLIDFVGHRVRFPAFRFDDADLAAYARTVRRRRPRWFYGYVSMLVQFAEYLRRTGTDPGPPPACIVTTSEVLTTADRARLEETFRTRVYNEYGCGELGTIAHECEQGRLHLTEENLLVEILDAGRACGPGEPGEIVVTELNNVGQPLIRYRTGDFGAFGRDPCSCGRGLRTLEGLYGRAYDIVVNRAGRRFHGEFMMYIFEEIRRLGIGVEQFQVEQTELDAFHVRLVPGPRFTNASRQAITTRIREQIDPQARVSFELVGAIEREKSGKMRLIKGLGARGNGAGAARGTG